MSPLADALAARVNAGDVPGLVAVVGRPGHRVDDPADDLETVVLGRQLVDGPDMRADSLFRIASAGKPITAAAVLALVADQQVALTDPVAEVLPELAAPMVLREPAGPLDDVVPASRPITVADLLRSTSGHGLPSDSSSPIAATLVERLHQGQPRPAEGIPANEWMARLGELPLIHQPGEGFTYNTSYDVLGVLVERVAGRPFADVVAERILRPLGMTDTGFVVPQSAADRTTGLYRRDEHGDLRLVDGPDGQWTTAPVFASGAGGYVSTAPDLVAFLRMLLAGGGDVLPHHLVAAMTTDQLTAEVRATSPSFLGAQSWGFGGGVDIAVTDPWTVPGRFGWVGGTGTSAYVVPSDGSVAVLLTQVEISGPTEVGLLETFWTAAADQLGHGAS